jgi:hypothetical protein
MLKGLANLLPQMSTNISNDFSAIWSVCDVINYYMPVKEFFVCLGIYIAVINWRVIWGAIKLLIERIVI